MKTPPIALAALALFTASAAEAAPRTWVRDVTVHTGWRWGQPPTEDFAATLREEVDQRLAVCAAGQDLRLDIKIERLNIRQPKDLRPNDLNFLDAQVKVRRAGDKSVVDLTRIHVQAEDDPLLSLVQDPEIVLSEALGDAICRDLFPAKA
jgi:protein involved in temperature-dependent protein secretion